jgi:hypothetical protein
MKLSYKLSQEKGREEEGNYCHCQIEGKMRERDLDSVSLDLTATMTSMDTRERPLMEKHS